MRLAIIGSSGSGKSTLANLIAHKLGIKYIEQDKLFWLPGWKEKPRDQFVQDVLKEIAEEEWVICGNHSTVQEKVWQRATHIVWLNYSLSTCLSRAFKRTIRRVFLAEECCNGNRESFRHAFFSKNSILWWILKTYNLRKFHYENSYKNGKFSHAIFFEFNVPSETDVWFKKLS